MAIVMAGCVVGAVAALMSVLLLDFGILAALAIWAASGPASVIACLVVMAVPPIRRPANQAGTTLARPG